MKITYYCDYSDMRFNGYLVKEDKEFIYISDLLISFWMEKLDRKDLLEKMTLRTYLKKDLYYSEIKNEINLNSDILTIFNFPILNYKVEEMSYISLFFEHFIYKNLSLMDKLKQSLKAVDKLLDNKIIKDIILFISDNFSKKERLNILLDPELNKYFQGGN